MTKYCHQHKFDIKSNTQSLTQNHSIFAHKTKFQLQVVQPSLNDKIKEQEVAFQQLCCTLQQRYYTETEITEQNACGNVCQSDRDRLATLELAEKEAYSAWIALIPTVPESYQAFCEAIKKRQAIAFNKARRKMILDEINSNAKLAAEFYVKNNNNPAIIERFKQKWTSQLEEAKKAGNIPLVKHFKQLSTYLKIATDKAEEPDKRAEYYGILARFLRGEITVYLEKVAKIDEMFDITSFTGLIDSETFTDCIFADLGTSLAPDSYSTFISNLKTGNITGKMLDIMLKELRLKRDMILASIDINDPSSVTSKRRYIEVVVALGALYQFAPEYIITAREIVKDKGGVVELTNADAMRFTAEIGEFIKRYLIYLEARKLQDNNAGLFSKQEESIFIPEVKRLRVEIQREVNAALVNQYIENILASSSFTASAA